MKQVILSVLLVSVLWSAVYSEVYKVNEAYPYPLDLGSLCGDSISYAYDYVCGYGGPLIARRKRAIRRDFKFLVKKTAANRFLHRTKRNAESGSGQANIQEECCGENCRTEEVREYC